ncbi:hypothetical protein PL8927_550173 [Planktothrix serta PCC 8927]|uniref:Uncharacterized protein n=1 Tax=Planktothrix serta PCC 8927 TaxID=671068 RepID=A0A7Z9BLD8_9CYAN|nr:hypothetical protein [Planktothrix serta]VXD17014.1 hypothetical protein PL8927_550173 [Planktothrix serta PCC 8927]
MKQLLIMIIEYLRRIINPDSDIIININPYNAPRNGIITLEETDPSATLTEVNLIGFEPEHTYAFKLDVQGKRISQYLNPSEPKINTACDGIIFTIIDGIFYVFFCEMKSKNPKLQDCIIKYINSTLFIKYIFNIIREFYQVSSEFSFNEIEYKYILFDLQTNAQKTPTSGRRNKVIPQLFVDSDDEKSILVYQIHHLTSEDLFNIRHLNLN